ncbi:MAG TPA: ABC-2 family transporter protein [Gemmatimonadaceae bacterium]|jgi:ABC-2 type transport system permease protein
MAQSAVRAFFAIVRTNAARELQYRANFFASLFGTVFWLAMALLTVHVFYSHTESLGGWTFWETVVLLGVFNALVGVVEGVLRPGIGSLPDEVRHGSLDQILVRPIDPQLYLSIRELDLWRIVDVVLGLSVSIYALHRLGRPLTLPGAASFAVTFATAIIVLYSLWVALMSLAFWLVAVENLSTVFDSVFEAARYPSSAYPTPLRIIFVFLLPVAWMTTTPASALTGRLQAIEVLESVIVAAASLIVSRAIWRFGLKRYTSAGG